MFERFTDRARRIVMLAQEECQLLNHQAIGPEHVLLGLIHEGEGVAGQVLREAGLTLDDCRTRITPGATPSPHHAPFTPEAKRTMELTLREALQLGHNYVGTEHILMALVRQAEAQEIFQALGHDPGDIRKAVVAKLTGQAKPQPEPEKPGCPHQYVTDAGTLILNPHATSDERCNHRKVTLHFEFDVEGKNEEARS